MPQACADKLKREMNDYGFPPKFPEEGEKEESKQVRMLFPCSVKTESYRCTMKCTSVLCKTLTLSSFLKGTKLTKPFYAHFLLGHSKLL